MAWTDERVGVLKKMWGEGQSASQIAKVLGGVTRNAVIGKVHRLGLSGRPSPIKKVLAKPVVVRKEPPPMLGEVERPCQWPFGDPGEPDFYFCRRESMEGKPYCPEHVARAYQRPSDTEVAAKEAAA